MPTLLLNFLKNNWVTLVVIAVLMVAGAGLGYLAAGHTYQHDIDQANQRESATRTDFDAFKLTAQTEKTAAAQQSAAELADALTLQKQYQAEAETLSAQLLAKQGELEQARQAFQRTIKNVIEKDGVAYTGIGPHSLCALRASLGYSGCGERVPGATGADAGHPADAASPAGGLSPAGILGVGSDYGTWCQTLESKLRTLNAFYQGADKKDGQ